MARLTHNIHGPHDGKFHGLLKQLEEEYTAVRLSGYSGEGFYSNGTRLGVGKSHNPSMTDARRQALAAAEKRQVFSGSGQKLGGGARNNITTPDYQDMRERVAAAALRRARISKTCGAESGVHDRGRMEADAERAIKNGFRTQTEEDNANEEAILQAAIDLIAEGEREEAMERKAWEERGGYVWIEDDDDEPVLVPVPVAASMARSAGSKHSRSASSEYSPTSERKRPVSSNPLVSDTPPTYEEAVGVNRNTWTCDLCTLINPVSSANCDACGVQRPEGGPEIVEVRSRTIVQPIRPGGLKRSTSVKTKQRVRFGPDPVTSVKRMWDCHNCTAVNDAGWWTCTTCGIMKTSS